MKRRLFDILDFTRPEDSAGRLFNITMTILITLNVVAVIIESVESLHSQWRTSFRVFEVFSVVAFSVEYLLRLWAAPAGTHSQGPLRSRIRFVFSPLGLIDLLAVLPFYLPFLIAFDLRILRALRLVRLVRIFKLGRYSNSVRTLAWVLKSTKEELLIALIGLALLLVLSSSLMYYVEHSVQPEAFSSIPVAMWWGVATLTTVGYGDVYPITPLGKLLGAVIAILGIGMFALPAGILASGFASEMRRDSRTSCPHCGRPV